MGTYARLVKLLYSFFSMPFRICRYRISADLQGRAGQQSLGDAPPEMLFPVWTATALAGNFKRSDATVARACCQQEEELPGIPTHAWCDRHGSTGTR